MNHPSVAPLLISHIPKTAGTSLKTLIERCNPDVVFVYERQLALGNPDFNFIMRFRELPAPSVVMGHFSFSVHRLLGVQPRYASVLRDPIQRITSLYRYQRSLPDSPFAEALHGGMTLAEFVSSGITEMTNNHMCRMIAGVPAEEGGVIRERWLLEYALHNLLRYYEVVGVVEQYDKVIAKLASVLGWPRYSIPIINVTKGKHVSIDKRTYKIILDNNRLDFELYQKVCEMS
jgi:hypothetical protein